MLVAGGLALAALALPTVAPAATCTAGSHCVNSIDLGLGLPHDPVTLCATPPGWSTSWICFEDVAGAKFKLQQVGGPAGVPVVFCLDLGERIMVYAAWPQTFQMFEYWWDTSLKARSNCTAP